MTTREKSHEQLHMTTREKSAAQLLDEYESAVRSVPLAEIPNSERLSRMRLQVLSCMQRGQHVTEHFAAQPDQSQAAVAPAPPNPDALNAAVTKAIFLAEWTLESAIMAWRDVLAAEQALADTLPPGVSRDIAWTGVGSARVTLQILTALRGATSEAR